MELNKEAIDNTKILTADYMDKLADKNFIRELLFIVEESMNEDIKYHFIKDKNNPAYVDTNNISLYIDPSYILKPLKDYIKIFKSLYPRVDETILYNFFTTGTILHELSHLDQAGSKYPYEEINRLYRLFYDSMDASKLKQLKYRVNRGSFFHERNAWIPACIDLFKIYEFTELAPIATNLYLAYLMDGYEDGNSPVSNTFSNIGLPYGFDVRGIPFRELLYHGFFVDENKFDEVIDFIGDKRVEDLSVRKIDQKIRSLG